MNSSYETLEAVEAYGLKAGLTKEDCKVIFNECWEMFCHEAIYGDAWGKPFNWDRVYRQAKTCIDNRKTK